MKARNTKLREVLDKFLTETLRPMSTDELSKAMSQFPADLPETYSRLFTSSIRNNCLAEFEKIIEERNLTEKLNHLDSLVAQKSGFEVSMAAFEFTPSDPEIVKKTIMNQAKRHEIESLERTLEHLRDENAQLELRESDTRRRLEQAERQVEAARRAVASVE